jgi:hypothetical protein
MSRRQTTKKPPPAPMPTMGTPYGSRNHVCPLCGKRVFSLVKYQVSVGNWNQIVGTCESCRFWLTRQIKGLVEK